MDGTVLEDLEVPPRAEALGLEPHPEGGWFRRTWTVGQSVETPRGWRPTASSILFLLPPGEQSIWHVVTSDELWLWHGPGPLVLETGGTGAAPGDCIDRIELDAEHVQHLVPGGVWQRTLPSAGECLVTCVVSPGFDFADFTLQPGV